MAKKKAIVDIKLNGLNTIADLENYLQEINGELKNMDINSQAFKDLSNNAAEAAGKLKDVNTKLEGVTSTEKAEGVLKLGEGFAGVFAVSQGLSLALGKNNEELEKVVQKVGGLLLALDGMRKAVEAVSAENIKRLAGVGRSFTALQAQVKAFSLASKAALASIGIGLIIAAVLLLIANWEKLTDLVNNRQRKKTLEAELDVLDRQLEQTRAINAERQKQIGVEKEIDEIYNLQDKSLGYQLETAGLLLKEQNLSLESAARRLELQEMALKRADDQVGNWKAQLALSRNITKVLENQVDAWVEAVNAVELTKAQQETLLVQIRKFNAEIQDIGQKMDWSLELEMNADWLHDIEKALIAANSVSNNTLVVMDGEVAKRKIIKEQIELAAKSDLRLLEINAKELALIEDIYNRRKLGLELTEEELLRQDLINKSQEELKDYSEAIIEYEKERANLGKNLTDEEVRRLEILDEEITAIRYRQKIIRLQLLSDIAGVKNARNRLAIEDEFNTVLTNQSNNLKSINALAEQRERLAQRNAKLFDLTKQGLDEAIRLQEEAINFDVRGNKLLADRVNELYPSQIKLQRDLYNEVIRFVDAYDLGYESADAFGTRVAELAEQAKTNIISQNQLGIKFRADELNDAANRLALEQAISEIVIADLEKQQGLAETQLGILESRAVTLKEINEDNKRQLAIQGQILTDEQNGLYVLLEKAKKNAEQSGSQEKVLDIQQRILDAERTYTNIKSDILKTDGEILQSSVDIVTQKENIKDLTYEQEDAQQKVVESQKQITDELENQERFSSKANEFITEYAAEIAVVADAIGGVFDLLAQKQENIAKEFQRQSKDFANEIRDREKALEDLGKTDEELQAELADANGARYEQIQAALALTTEQRATDYETEKGEIEGLKKQQAQADFDAAMAEYNAAQIRKKQALVDAAIGAALAIVKALPNIFLVAATAIASGIAIATIAAKKNIPPKAADFGLQEGGFTPNVAVDQPAGIVHGGEYVVPNPVLQTSEGAAMVSMLENIRQDKLRGYQEGGAVVPASNVDTSNYIDYKRLGQEVAGAMGNMRIVTELVPLARGLKDVNKVQTQAGI